MHAAAVKMILLLVDLTRQVIYNNDLIHDTSSTIKTKIIFQDGSHCKFCFRF